MDDETWEIATCIERRHDPNVDCLPTVFQDNDPYKQNELILRTFPEGLFDSATRLESFIYSGTSQVRGIAIECKLPKSLRHLQVEEVNLSNWRQVVDRLESPASLRHLSLKKGGALVDDETAAKLSPEIYLDLTGNLVECDLCRILRLPNLKIDRCFSNNFTSKSDLVQEFDRENLLKANCYIDRMPIIGGALAVFVLILVAVIVAFISESLRVRLYHNRFFGQFFIPDFFAEEMDFDVFVSYAEEDSDLALKIAQKLEGTFSPSSSEPSWRTFRCCLHQRDWTAGREISSNIMDSVERSCRTVVLMSRNFLKSPFCLQEFRFGPKMTNFFSLGLN